MFKYIKSFFKKKQPSEVIEKVGDKLTITTHFDNKVEIRRYKLCHYLTEYKHTKQ